MGVQYVGQVEDSLSAFKPNKSKKKKSHYKTAGKRLVHDKQTKILHIWSSTDEIISLLQFLYAVIRRLGHPLQHTTFNFQYAFYDGAVSMWKYTETLAHLNAQGVFNLRLRNQIKSKSMVLNHLSKDNFVHIENLLKLTKDSMASCEILQATQIVITVHGNVIDSSLDKKSEELVRGLQNENNKLKQQNFALKTLLENKDKENTTLVEKITALENELRNLRDVHAQLSEEHQGTLHDLGKLSFERDTNVNKIKRAKIFQKIFDTKTSSGFIDTPNASGSPSSFSKSTTCCDQGLSPSHNQHVCQPQNAAQELPSSSQYTPRKQLKAEDVLVESRELTLVNENETSSPNNNRHERSRVLPSHSVEVDKLSESESLSLRNEPCSSVTAEVRNIYKLLLLTIADRLLLGDIAKLNDWANERFGIDTNLSATEIVCQLDQKGVINAFDLSQLHAFFQSILRIDLVYLIDEFTKGDYPSLRKMISVSNPKRQNCVGNSNRNQRSVVLMRNSTFGSSMSPNVFSGVGNNDHLTERTDASTKNGNLSNVNNHGDWSRKLASLRAPTSSASGSSVVVPDEHAASSHGGYISHANSPTTSNSPSTSGENNAMKMPTPSSQDPTNHCSRKQCNGTSQSQPRNRHQTSNTHNMQEKKWLCSHYKRRCHVKFDCCEKFWPCHQCHNKESTCSRKNLKARDTKLVKCSECGKEQQFGEFCVSCNIKFADFYCGLCKHVTGTDDFPYHCDKCGICRIHGDRSFHCDICGVCLDVQLRGNHKCRPGSAHDQCGICLEDAFTGCQILPCSHKVHKHCATQMIQSGITRCPICRESFAHKLNKRQPTRKLSRKR